MGGATSPIKLRCCDRQGKDATNWNRRPENRNGNDNPFVFRANQSSDSRNEYCRSRRETQSNRPGKEDSAMMLVD